MFIFNSTKRNSAFIKLTSFKSVLLVKFQVSTLHESQHLLVKLSCESACENLDALSAICIMFFSANIAAEQGVIVAAIVIALCLFTAQALLIVQCTPTHVQSKPSSDFSLRYRLQK